MNYKETIFKDGEIHWKPTKFHQTKDGKTDLRVTIPLNAILDAQAKQSFVKGVATVLSFTATCQQEQTIITLELLKLKFKEWGILDAIEEMESKKAKLKELGR